MYIYFLFLSLLLSISPTLSHAQDKKDKEEKPPVFNYVLDDPMDKFQPQKDSLVTYNYLVPEFYFHTPRMVKDTTFEFFCYDRRDSLLTVVTDFDSVFYYSLYKSYTDSAHTYIDSAGKEQFLPVSSIVKRYDRIGKEKWMNIEYPHNKYSEIRGNKKNIVARDSVITYSSVGAITYKKIYNYYGLK